MLKKILIGLTAIVVLFFAIGFVLPSKQTVERSASFDAKPAAVYAYLNGYRRFNEWSPWAQIDPNTRYTFSGPPVGVGAKQDWDSKDPNAGKGSQEIIKVEPYKLIQARLLFADFEGENIVSYVIAAEGEGTRLTWRMESDLGGNPVNRWFGTMLDKMVGKDYDKGLANLKSHLEALPKDDIEGIEIASVQTQAQPYLYVSAAADEASASAKLAETFGKVAGYFDANGLKPAGAPIAMTRSFDEKTTRWEFNAGIPVAAAAPPAADSGVQLATTPAGYALRATHTGPYSAMQPSYGKLLAYKAAAGLQDVPGSGAWEQYLSDPANTPAEKLTTHIYWPVQ